MYLGWDAVALEAGLEGKTAGFGIHKGCFEDIVSHQVHQSIQKASKTGSSELWLHQCPTPILDALEFGEVCMGSAIHLKDGWQVRLPEFKEFERVQADACKLRLPECSMPSRL